MFSTQLDGKELYVHAPANNLTTMNVLKEAGQERLFRDKQHNI